jgi:RNA polymerase sigma-70 factor (ECF subfamily)
MAAVAAREIAVGEESLYAAIGAEAAPAVPAADAALLARLRAGERAAFEELVSAYQPLVYELAYRLLGDPEEARDVAQETFLKVYRHVGGFRGDSGLKTWLYRIAVNQASNHRRWWHRRRKRETVSLDVPEVGQASTLGERIASGSASPEQVALRRERERRVMAALETLKHDFRVAVVLRDVQELSYEEIAEALEISVGTVKSRIARGREELRKRLREMGV